MNNDDIKRFTLIKDKEYACFEIQDSEGRWEIGDVELDNLPCFEDLVDLLNELYDENLKLKKENNELKGRIINSLKESRNIKCNCNPCIAEETVINELLDEYKKEKYRGTKYWMNHELL